MKPQPAVVSTCVYLAEKFVATQTTKPRNPRYFFGTTHCPTLLNNGNNISKLSYFKHRNNSFLQPHLAIVISIHNFQT